MNSENRRQRSVFQPSYEHQVQDTYFCDACGKQYTNSWNSDAHERVCKSNKRDLSQLLESTKLVWEARKRRRLELVEARLQSSQNQGSTQGVNLARAVTQGAASGEPTTFDDLDIPIAQRKAERSRRAPAHFRQEDQLPEPPPAVQAGLSEAQSTEDAVMPDCDGTITTDTHGVRGVSASSPNALAIICSRRSIFRVKRTYLLPTGAALTHNPDQVVTLKDLTDTVLPSRLPARTANGKMAYGPFLSNSAFSLAEWYWNSNTKSLQDFQQLMMIFKDPHFSLSDAIQVDWKASFKALGANKDDLPDGEGDWIEDDGWISTPISINIPFHHRMKNPGTECYFTGNFRHRSIVSAIKEKILSKEDSRQFHYYPYRATWKSNEASPEVELYGEMYASQAFRDAHEELQKQPRVEGDGNLERVIVSLMFWSDSTHLTSFGTASLWPCYLFFGNESKYRRCKPSENLCQQVAYFEKLPDSFTDYLKERNEGKLPTDALMAYCLRELFHEQWAMILDEDLLDAMQNGICLLCPDGRRRRFYPRIFTYSADYPEKVLIVGIRNNGMCPCHRCLVAKSDLSNLGAPTDLERRDRKRDTERQEQLVADTREELLKNNHAVDGSRVEANLKSQSLVPVKSAFSTPLPPYHGLDITPTLVVDLLHEFEIGVWKRLYTHLLRILDALTSTSGPTLAAELDFRYRATPTFGRDTIRKFGVNASDMKRKAARDFEDLLQCAIPAFDGLLPEPHNSILMKLLFLCAQWHALAKLRLHSDLSLALLDYTTTLLGAQMRLFDRDSCSKIDTRELPKEAEARARREVKGKGKATASRKSASLNVFTIKFHYLGDYVSTIRKFGTCDSYSTEIGELSHRLPKSWYARTDKKQYTAQITQIERRQARLSRIRAEMVSTEGVDDHVEPSPDCRYHIGINQNDCLNLSTAVTNLPGSVHQPNGYLVNFIPKLKQHLLPRILQHLGFQPDSDTSSAEWTSVVLQDNRLYRHKIMRVNYTTYDIRRDEDVIHIDTPQCSVMMLNSDYVARSEGHPYLYAKVLGVFHANVSYIGVLPDGTRRHKAYRIEFLWVRWYDILATHQEFVLDRLSLCPLDSAGALGFLDPADVVWGVHLIPQFSKGKVEDPRGPNSQWVNRQTNWKAYYVNQFADRDMFMRYQYGMSVGHVYMHSRPPVIPSIPSDFDHCLPTAAPASTEPEILPIPILPIDLEVVNTTTSGVPGSILDATVPTATPVEQPSNDSNSEPATSTVPTNEPSFSEGIDARRAADGDQVDQANLEEDYLDELEDQEISIFEEMYGTGFYGAGLRLSS